MSPEQLRRMALRTGAQIEVGGKVVNAGRQRLSVVPKRPPPAEEPEPPKPARDPLRDLIAMQAAVAHQQTEALGRVLADITERLAPVERVVEVPAKRVQPVSIRVVRDAAGRAMSLEPTYGDVGGGQLAGLDTELDERGLVSTITPKYTGENA